MSDTTNTAEPGYDIRYAIRRWASDQIQAGVKGPDHAVSLPSAAWAGVEHFRKDALFVQAFLDFALRPMLYDALLQQAGQTRRSRTEPPKPVLITIGNQLVDRDKMVATIRQSVSEPKTKICRFDGFIESTNDRHKRILDMTRDELAEAARVRFARGTVETIYGLTWSCLVAGMRDGQIVSDVYKAEDIERIHAEMAKQHAAGMSGMDRAKEVS